MSPFLTRAVPPRPAPFLISLAAAVVLAAHPAAAGDSASGSPAGRLEILSAEMVSSHVFRVRTHQDLPADARVTVAVPFPGVSPSPTVSRRVASGQTEPVSFDFELDSLRVPRFRHTLKLRVRARAADYQAEDAEIATVPLPVVTVHGISPGAALLRRRPETGFSDLESYLVRQSRAERAGWGVYRRYDGGRSPERQEGYPTVFTFRWRSNRDSLEEGARDLEEFLLLRVRPATWAERAVVVGWSRGGNLTRELLSRHRQPDGDHPYAAGALLACMPATGSPLPYVWERYLSWLRRFPRGWDDVLPTYPWWREQAGPSADPVPFSTREPENQVLARLNERPRPEKLPVEALFGTRTVRDTLLAVTGSRGVQEGPTEYGDFAVHRFSAQGYNITLDPADPSRVTSARRVPWMEGVPAKEFVFDQRFRKPGVLHVAFLGQPPVLRYIYEWLGTHAVEEHAEPR